MEKLSGTKMKIWLTNRHKDVKPLETAWKDTVIEDPKSVSNRFSVEELKQLGYTGLYRTSDRKLSKEEYANLR